MNKTLKFQSILKSEDYKVIQITGVSGDVISSHKVDENSILIIKKGYVSYKENDREIELYEDEAHAIPKDITHEVLFKDDSHLLLVRPSGSIMKFDK